jgi:thioredoxin-related protein
MKKVLLLVTLVVSVFLMSFIHGDPLNIGDALPKADLKMKNVNGKDISLQMAKKENGLLVMFSCNTCPFVVKYQERTKAICAYAKSLNYGVVILNSNEAKRMDDDSFDAMKQYYKEQQYDWYYAVDANSTIADAFGAMRTPECFLFDKNLKLVYHGAIDADANSESNDVRKHLRIAIDELTGGKDIAIKTSRSVGCTIKRKG